MEKWNIELNSLRTLNEIVHKLRYESSTFTSNAFSLWKMSRNALIREIENCEKKAFKVECACISKSEYLLFPIDSEHFSCFNLYSGSFEHDYPFYADFSLKFLNFHTLFGRYTRFNWHIKRAGAKPTHSKCTSSILRSILEELLSLKHSLYFVIQK